MNNHSSNKHLNVFQSYSQKGSLPIENNISRGLAILFQEYPSLLFLFLSKLNQELGKTGSSFSIDYPSDSYCVDFQRHVDSFDSSEMIVGVTLTSEDLPNDGLEQPIGGSGDYITDISINYDNVIIFIEVKRNATDCRNQLALQINKYIDSITDNADMSSPQQSIVGLTWRNISELLSTHSAIHEDAPGRLCEDYLSFISINFPNWMPITPLSKLSTSEAERIKQRIRTIKYMHQKQYDSSNSIIEQREAIPLDWGYTREINVYYDSQFPTETGMKPCIVFGMWPADTVAQFRQWKGHINTSFFQTQYNKIRINSRPVCIRVFPYIKFSSWQKGTLWIQGLDLKQYDIDAWITFANDYVGRSKKAPDGSWGDIASRIENDLQGKVFSESEITGFKERFKREFIDSNRTTTDKSCGFQVEAYIPYEEAQKLDTSEGDTRIAAFLHSYISEIQSFLRISQKL